MKGVKGLALPRCDDLGKPSALLPELQRLVEQLVIYLFIGKHLTTINTYFSDHYTYVLMMSDTYSTESRGPMSSFLSRISTYASDILWKRFLDWFADSRILQDSPVAFIYKDKGHVYSRLLVHCDLRNNIWGARDVRCVARDCGGTLVDTRSKVSGEGLIALCLTCRRCGMSQVLDPPSWLQSINGGGGSICWHPLDKCIEQHIHACWTAM